MCYSFSRWFKVVCCMLIASLVIGMLPWRELSADANTHGKYTAKPFEITYEQNSTWGKSTQGQFVVKNTSKANVKSWVLEIDYSQSALQKTARIYMVIGEKILKMYYSINL